MDKKLKRVIQLPKSRGERVPRSKHVVDFEKKYGTKITNDSFISKNLLKREGIELVLSKATRAYYTSNQGWARARLASVLLGRTARTVDQDIWNKYKV
jgi:hypothetical protein